MNRRVACSCDATPSFSPPRRSVARAERTALLAEWPDGQPMTPALRRGRLGARAIRPSKTGEAIMSEKSHVSIERHLCLVCGAEYDTGAILLDRRLRASLHRYTTTGLGLCPEHKRLFDEGFVALVEYDPARSGQPSSADRLKPEQAYRTGRIAHLKRDSFARVFNVSIDAKSPLVFVQLGVIEKLGAMVGKS